MQEKINLSPGFDNKICYFVNHLLHFFDVCASSSMPVRLSLVLYHHLDFLALKSPVIIDHVGWRLLIFESSRFSSEQK